MDKNDRYIKRPEVTKRTGFSPGYLARLEAKGEFPKRRRIGGRTVAWLESEIEAWMSSRPLASDAPADVGGDLPSRGYVGGYDRR